MSAVQQSDLISQAPALYHSPCISHQSSGGPLIPSLTAGGMNCHVNRPLLSADLRVAQLFGPFLLFPDPANCALHTAHHTHGPRQGRCKGPALDVGLFHMFPLLTNLGCSHPSDSSYFVWSLLHFPNQGGLKWFCNSKGHRSTCPVPSIVSLEAGDRGEKIGWIL